MSCWNTTTRRADGKTSRGKSELDDDEIEALAEATGNSGNLRYDSRGKLVGARIDSTWQAGASTRYRRR